MDEARHIHPTNNPTEGIDFGKLWMTIRNNLVWIVLIFVLINLATYLLFIRYSPNVYSSHSEIKLDIKNDASELGIKPFVDDQKMNIISGEIELIQSRLFLNRVLDSIRLDVSYFNKGDVLNFEFFGNTPFTVAYKIENSALYNKPIFVNENNGNSITIRTENDVQAEGRYGDKITLPGIELILHKNPDFARDKELNSFFVIRSRDVLMDYLLQNLTVEPLNFNANTIRISFKDYNALKAQTIVNKIDSLYLEYSNEQKNLTNKQKIDWLSNELRQIEQNMGEYEDYFEEFILENKTNNLNEELSNVISIIHDLDSQRFLMSRRIGEINQITESLNSEDFYVSVTQRTMLPLSVNESLTKLQQLKQDIGKLKLSYKEITFAYREREHEIASLEGELFGQLTELRTAWLKQLQELNQQKSRLEREFALMPSRNTQFTKNQRFYKLYEEFYLSLMQAKSEFEIAQAGTTPDFKILSPASISSIPIAPKKTMLAGIGLIGSIVINLFFIGILYLSNNKITSLQELEHGTQVPVLGVIPASGYSNGSIMHVLDHPKSMATEAFRTLRTNLDFFNPSSTRQTIAISSTISGEGKSFIALNLGGIIALSDKKVVLLDLDMRKPKANLQAPFNDHSKGMSTILIRKNTWQECVIRTSLPNFDFIASGPHPPNPAELLLQNDFASLLDDLKTHYDYIILDTPPVGLVTDGIMAMKRSDISIYIFRANYSKRDFLNNLRRIMLVNKFSNITMLLNAIPVKDRNTYGYGYYEEPKKNRLKSIFKR